MVSSSRTKKTPPCFKSGQWSWEGWGGAYTERAGERRPKGDTVGTEGTGRHHSEPPRATLEVHSMGSTAKKRQGRQATSRAAWLFQVQASDMVTKSSSLA